MFCEKEGRLQKCYVIERNLNHKKGKIDHFHQPHPVCMYFVDRLNTFDTFIVYINIKYLYMYIFVVLFFLVVLKAIFIALVGELV